MRLFLIKALILLLSLVAQAAQTGSVAYDPDPQHLWNRLNTTLFLRTAHDGKPYGLDRLDILFWRQTKHLLSEPSHQPALAALDEFIEKRGEQLVTEPLKRALLQRDLWELFDWSAMPQRDSKDAAARRELQMRLAKVIRSLALTTNQIAALPDNYAAAEKNLALTELPRGMFHTNSDWVCTGINGGDAAATAHVQDFGGRSVFLVMLRHPQGRKAAVEYLNKLRSFSPMWLSVTNENSPRGELALNPALPQFPVRTQWALVRRMCVIDSDGHIQPTRLVESVQARTYLKISQDRRQTLAAFEERTAEQHFVEFNMARRPGAPLVAVAQGEKEFTTVQFRSIGGDPFEFYKPGQPAPDSAVFKQEVLKSCANCHVPPGPGILSVNSFNRMFYGMPSLRTTEVVDLSPEREERVTLDWKRRQFDWGLLQGLWR